VAKLLDPRAEFVTTWPLECQIQCDLRCRGQLGYSGWAKAKHEQTKSRKHVIWMVLFDSGHLQNECERPDMEWKYM